MFIFKALLKTGILFLVILMVEFIAIPKVYAVCVTQPSGMVAWWGGDNNALDLAGTNNAMLVNGVLYASGKVGQAFSFDGSDDIVEVPDSLALRITGTVSISFWAKRNRFGIDHIVEKGGDWNIGEPNYGAGFHTINNNMFYFLFKGGWRGTDGVSDLAWHHYTVVATHGDANPKFYIDGVESASLYGDGSATINLYPSTLPLHIGAQTGQGTVGNGIYYGNNNIDELAIFNRALDVSEIASIYNAGNSGICRPCAPPPSGMVSWWGGDNNALDLVGTNNGTLVNGVLYSSGKLGQAFSFDGVDDYVFTPLPTAVTDLVTLDVWVKWGGPNASVARQLMLYNGNYDSAGYGIFVENDGTIAVLIGQGASTVLTTNAILAQGTWQHVAAVRNAGTWTVYVDGQSVSIISGNSNAAPSIPSVNAMIGGSGDASTSFKGLLDEVHIFSRALSADEIGAIYNAGSSGICRSCAPPPSGMVSWWGGDNNALDMIGTNAGTWGGVPAYVPGNVGEAFSFNGLNQFVSLSDADFRSDVARTMAFWVQTTDAGAPIVFGDNGPLKGAFFGRGNHTTQHLHLGIASGKQTVEWYDNGHHSIQGTSNIADGNWHHLVFVSDGAGTVSLYVDTVLENSGTFFHTSGSTSTRFGSQYEGNGNYNYFYNGLLDEVQIFSRALLADEIAAIYNAGSAGVCLDTAPDAFTFTDQTDVVPATMITSDAITITGIAAAAAISITGGEYSVSTDGGTNWSDFSTTTPATVNLNEQVKVRQTSSAIVATRTDTILTVGGVSDTFSVATRRNGDVNGDTNVNIVDALFVARHAAGLSVSGFNASVADVNCDGHTNIVDALLIARKAAGLAVSNWCQ